ncbi:MAG: hypothetical protein CMF96_11675 [Candidatus Marinimicrobia bacterium]|nr:hypothetical protein [Candidatus Neomarinimicrobiota bacterium]|tara:strand:+ start:904 stop:3309 length:2406 start_codon:yes stop_codon:yes gene_type:complete
MLYLHTAKCKIPFIFSLFSTFIFSLTISGKVTDENGNPISNVNIYSVFSGTTTDDNGNYNLKLEDSNEITISHIGFEEIQIHPKNLNEIIILKKSTLLGKNVNVNSSLNKIDLYNTPSSVSLITSNELSIKPNNHFEGLIGQITNLNYTSGTSRPRYFQIRGIGERSHYAGEGPPNYSVGFLIDGIDFSGIGMTGHLFDVKQIEVFKGPQSTVFGPNAVAGSINITTNKPTPFYTGKMETIFSSDNGKTFSGAIGGPILKTLFFRLSGTKHSQNGFRENVFLNKDDTNGKNESFIRSKLLWQPINDISVSYTNLKSNLDNKYDAWAPDNNENLITYSNKQGKDSQKSSSNALKINLPEIMGFTSEYKFTNSTNDLVHSYDSDWGNDSLWLNEYGVEGWSYDYFDKINRTKNTKSNELTFYSTDIISNPILKSSIIAGIYTSIITQDDSAIGYLFGGDATSLESNFKIKNTAFYGNFNSKYSDNWEINLNARSENHTTIYLGTSENFYNNYYYLDVNLPEIDTTKLEKFFGLNISIKNQINENFQWYSSYSKGYKAGGINQYPYLSPESRFFDSEFNINMELGGRLSWKKINLIFAIFNMKRTDLQVQVSSQQFEDDPSSFTYYTSNAGKGTNNGFELEFGVNIFSNVKLNYSFGYLNTHVEEFSYPVSLDTVVTAETSYYEEIYEFAGNRELAMAPKFNSSLNIHYTHNSGLFVNGNIISKDKYYFSDSHDQMSNQYSILNLDLGYRKNNLTILLWSKNITDKRYAVRGFYFGLEPPNYEDKLYLSYGNPQEIGIKVSYQF